MSLDEPELELPPGLRGGPVRDEGEEARRCRHRSGRADAVDALDANTAARRAGPAFPNGPYTARQSWRTRRARRATSGRARRRTTSRTSGSRPFRPPEASSCSAGQRAEPFYVDLGSIFDLGGLRPFNMAHLIPLATTNGVDATKDLNIYTIAIQVPITMLTPDGGCPTSIDRPERR